MDHTEDKEPRFNFKDVDILINSLYVVLDATPEEVSRHEEFINDIEDHWGIRPDGYNELAKTFRDVYYNNIILFLQDIYLDTDSIVKYNSDSDYALEMLHYIIVEKRVLTASKATEYNNYHEDNINLALFCYGIRRYCDCEISNHD